MLPLLYVLLVATYSLPFITHFGAVAIHSCHDHGFSRYTITNLIPTRSRDRCSLLLSATHMVWLARTGLDSKQLIFDRRGPVTCFSQLRDCHHVYARRQRHQAPRPVTRLPLDLGGGSVLLDTFSHSIGSAQPQSVLKPRCV